MPNRKSYKNKGITEFMFHKIEYKIQIIKQIKAPPSIM